MRKRILSSMLAMAVAILSVGCDSMFLDAPPVVSSPLTDQNTASQRNLKDAEYQQHLEEVASQETSGMYESELPYAFCVDEERFDLDNIVFFRILDFIEKDHTFIYAFQAPLKDNDEILVTSLMSYRFDAEETYGIPGSEQERQARIGNGRILFEAKSVSDVSEIEALEDDDSAQNLGSSVLVSGEQSMYAYKLPYDEGYFLYFNGIARYYKPDGTCYRTVDLSGSYNAAIKDRKAKGYTVNDVSPMFFRGMESIVLTATFTDYADGEDLENSDEEAISNKTHGVVFLYQFMSLNGKYFWKRWNADESGNEIRLISSPIQLAGYGGMTSAPLVSGSPLAWLGDKGSKLPQGCYMADPALRSVDRKLWLSGSVSNVETILYYKTVKDKDGNETEEPDYYERKYLLSSDSYMLLCNYIYDCELGFEAIDQTETLCFGENFASWLPDDSDLQWSKSSTYAGHTGQIKQEAIFYELRFSEKYGSEGEAIHAAGEIPKGFALFSSSHIYLTFFKHFPPLYQMDLDRRESISLDTLNFSAYQPEFDFPPASSEIEYNWDETNSTYSTSLPDLPSQSEGDVPAPDVQAPNPDNYAIENLLVLGQDDYLFTGPSNGVVRYREKQAEQVLKAAVFRTWKLSDGSFLAVGFDTGKQRYTISSLPRARIIRFDI